ncbi:MAG: hypothetical protein M3441_23700 [Chloroflexota bacterium]|jgi:hypothetical protein|nr:hypothetical protein [Chloroflexota bacterium]
MTLRISIRRILLLVIAGAMLAAMAASPASSEEAKDRGKPADPNCWGTAASQVATTFPTGSFGEHASSQETPRQGVGNVARNDDADGTRPSDHAALVGPQMGIP